MSRNDTSLQPLSSNAVSAKELARSLGLVKKRPTSSTSRSKCQEREDKPSQYFTYLIVLDFESTCWKDKKMNYGPEIIEFPAVLLNTSTGEMESEFHMFVQPSEHTRLSEFCTELTGITQTQVDEGVPVGTCLMLFGRWLQEMREKKGFKFPCDQILNKDENKPTENLTKWCTFVTWSDWDLGTCLKNECYRKQLRVPHPLRSWTDLRATYKTFYSRKPQGLAGALQDLGIQFAGREHSGLDDARNTARLAWRMVSDGCIMQITKSTDGAVEKLWNIVTMKPGLSQNNLKANGTGAFHTSNQSELMSEDMQALHNKHHARPSKNCTDETSVNKSLNFGDFQAQNQCRIGTRQKVTVKSEMKEPRSVQIPGNSLTNHHVKPSKSCTEETSVNESLSFGKAQEECRDVHVHGTQQSITVKRELTGARAEQFPENRMTNLRKKSLVWGAVKNGNNSEANGQNKRKASVSSVSEGIPVGTCDGVCATPKNTSKSLLTPATCLSSLNKRAKGCCNGLCRSELQSCSAQGFLVKRGLAKQTLCYHQHTPLGSHNQRVLPGMGQKDYTTCNQPCKASNIEPQSVNTPLFRLPTNHSLIEERHSVEGLKNDKSMTVASNYTGITAINKPIAKATIVATTSSSIYLNKPCTTPIRKFLSFNPPLHGNMNSPVTTPVAYFNGGGITPPLCHCGRRTRRRAVINPGPNQGRAFFTCSFSHGRTTSGANAEEKKKTKSGCKFFRWEVRL